MEKQDKKQTEIVEQISLTVNEANGLIDILNIAVKSEGLPVAEFCFMIQKKIQTQFNK